MQILSASSSQASSYPSSTPLRGKGVVIAFAVLLLAATATYLLVKSLQARVKKVDPPTAAKKPTIMKRLASLDAAPIPAPLDSYFSKLLSYGCVVSLLSPEECNHTSIKAGWDLFRGSYGKGMTRDGVLTAAKTSECFSLLIHYPFWPAHQDLPDDKHCVALLECARTISRSLAPSIFIQCADSQGRTATFIALVEFFRKPKSIHMQSTLASLKAAGHTPTPAQEKYLLSDALALQIQSIPPD